MVLELNAPDDCKVYGPKGDLLEEVIVKGKIPDLIPGENEITFSCVGPEGMNARVQVTVIRAGEPLNMSQ